MFSFWRGRQWTVYEGYLQNNSPSIYHSTLSSIEEFNQVTEVSIIFSQCQWTILCLSYCPRNQFIYFPSCWYGQRGCGAGSVTWSFTVVVCYWHELEWYPQGEDRINGRLFRPVSVFVISVSGCLVINLKAASNADKRRFSVLGFSEN